VTKKVVGVFVRFRAPLLRRTLGINFYATFGCVNQIDTLNENLIIGVVFRDNASLCFLIQDLPVIPNFYLKRFNFVLRDLTAKIANTISSYIALKKIYIEI
jgi:hypothetical protein